MFSNRVVICLASILTSVITLGIFVLLKDDGVVFSVAYREIEVKIIREDGGIDSDTFVYQIFKEGKTIVGPFFLGTAVKERRFRSMVLENEQIIAIYEENHPNVILIAYELKTGEYWPNWENIPVGEMIIRKINKSLKRADLVGEDLNSLIEN